MAQRALQAFDRDYDLTEEFNGIENGKWRKWVITAVLLCNC